MVRKSLRLRVIEPFLRISKLKRRLLLSLHQIILQTRVREGIPHIKAQHTCPLSVNCTEIVYLKHWLLKESTNSDLSPLNRVGSKAITELHGNKYYRV